MLCVSKDLCDIATRCGLTKHGCVRYWRSGVDLHGFAPHKRNSDRRTLLMSGKSSDAPLIVHSGRLTIEKQSEKLPILFEAISARLQGHVSFAIFGDGDQRDAIERQCALRGLPLYCTGYLRGEELCTVKPRSSTPMRLARNCVSVFYDPRIPRVLCHIHGRRWLAVTASSRPAPLKLSASV